MDWSNPNLLLPFLDKITVYLDSSLDIHYKVGIVGVIDRIVSQFINPKFRIYTGYISDRKWLKNSIDIDARFAVRDPHGESSQTSRPQQEVQTQRPTRRPTQKPTSGWSSEDIPDPIVEYLNPKGVRVTLPGRIYLFPTEHLVFFIYGKLWWAYWERGEADIPDVIITLHYGWSMYSNKKVLL